MTEDTAARRLAKIIGRVEGMTFGMASDMNDVRQRLLALDALIADEEQAVTNQQLRAQLRAEQAWSRRLADVHRVWAQRLEQHGNDLEHRLFGLGLTEGAMLDQPLLDIIDRLDALRHDMEEGT